MLVEINDSVENSYQMEMEMVVEEWVDEIMLNHDYYQLMVMVVEEMLLMIEFYLLFLVVVVHDDKSSMLYEHVLLTISHWLVF
jgi:hypothetical protein